MSNSDDELFSTVFNRRPPAGRLIKQFGVDMAHEELYESRVYQIHPELLARIVLEAAEEESEIAIAALLVAGSEDATFRMMAKRGKDDGRVTFIVVGVLAGIRTLLAREDGVEEQRFREFVQGFEAGAFSRGLASEPSVVTLDQWRTYDPRNPGGADSP